MIERALGHAGQVAASALVAAVLIGAGFAGLDGHGVSGVAAGALTRPSSSPVVTWSSPTPVLTATSARPTPLADELTHGAARVPPHLDSVAPKTAEVPIHAVIVMSFSQRMNRQSVQASFLIQPAAEGRFVWSDDYTLRFEPFRLAFSTSYQVEVSGRSTVGSMLSGSRWWQRSCQDRGGGASRRWPGRPTC